MAGLTETQRGILASSMSAASAGLMLGRSAAWVERMRGELAETTPSPAPPEPMALADPALKQPGPAGRAIAPKPSQPPAASRQPPAAAWPGRRRRASGRAGW